MPTAVAPWIVSDELWRLVGPSLPTKEQWFRYPGRKRLGDREALQGVLLVLHTGIAWRHLPLELGFGSRASCYRRLDEWQRASVWERLHEVLLDGYERRVRSSGRWRSPIPAMCRQRVGFETGPSPVDRARNESKRHLLVDTTGIPLAWTLTGGNRNDVSQLTPLVDAVPPVRGRVGRPRRRPERVSADRGYDHDKYRRQLPQRGIRPEIARRGTEHGSGLGRYRWVAERAFAWLHQFKRLLVRYDRRAETHEAFLALGCCLVCFRRLRRSL